MDGFVICNYCLQREEFALNDRPEICAFIPTTRRRKVEISHGLSTLPYRGFVRSVSANGSRDAYLDDAFAPIIATAGDAL